MKKTLLSLSLILFVFLLNAQSNFNIKGVVQDTSGNALISSTVLLLEKSDSTLVEFTRTELDGSFAFKKIKAGKYLIKTTYIGYIPRTVDASSTGDNINLGEVEMVELAVELMNVVIKAAKAPIKMRGDTIEYDASTFVVPEGSSVEELLKQLPGIEVDQDGSILADGKNVSKVTVDGKKFFGSDPKAATKNLPAEGISKIQVFDTKTEEEKITGATSDSEDKTMNLELKEDFKKGGFGRVTGGLGTEERAELKGNYNKFNEKIQFSIVAVGNNTGRNGLGWDDYQDFLGSSAFNFSDDGDYGFGGGGGRYFITFGGNNSGPTLESSIQSIFFNNSGGGGFPENYNGGVNFNYNHKKTEFSSVYYYNQAGLDRVTNVNRASFLPDFTLNQKTARINDDLSRGHRAEISLEQEIDSFHSIRIEMNGAYIDQNNITKTNLNLSNGSLLTSSTALDNDFNSNGYLYNGIMYFRKRFRSKKGRRFGANVSYLGTSLDDTGVQNSTSEFFGDTGTVDSISATSLATINLGDKQVFKTNAVYVEPLSKRFFSQTFYNFSNRHETGDRDVTNLIENTIDGFLSRDFENTIQLNRAGSALRYSHKGVNVSVGAAYQQFNLTGFNNIQYGGGSVVDKVFTNWIPHFSFNMSPARNAYISANYTINAVEPNISDLQPIIDNRNPLYIREGNPELTPEIVNAFSASVRRTYPISGIRFNVNANYDYYSNQIITDETVDENLITYVKPINYDGGDRISLFSNFSFPIIKNKLKSSIRMRFNHTNSFAFVNDFLNKTTSQGYSPSVNLNYYPGPKTNFSVRASWNIVDTKYEVNTSQDQTNTNSTLTVSANSVLFSGFYFNSSFDLRTYNNDRFGMSESVPILNASIYKQFWKGNRAEVRLSIYDALNRNVSISQFASGNSVTESQTTALGRYVMLSLSYNIKGLKDGVSKERWW